MRVVKLMRQRRLGNNTSQLQNNFPEQHNVCLQRIVHYLTDCQTFVEPGGQQLVPTHTFDDQPSYVTLYKTSWLLTVFPHPRKATSSLPDKMSKNFFAAFSLKHFPITKKKNLTTQTKMPFRPNPNPNPNPNPRSTKHWKQ